MRTLLPILSAALLLGCSSSSLGDHGPPVVAKDTSWRTTADTFDLPPHATYQVPLEIPIDAAWLDVQVEVAEGLVVVDVLGPGDTPCTITDTEGRHTCAVDGPEPGTWQIVVRADENGATGVDLSWALSGSDREPVVLATHHVTTVRSAVSVDLPDASGSLYAKVNGHDGAVRIERDGAVVCGDDGWGSCSAHMPSAGTYTVEGSVAAGQGGLLVMWVPGDGTVVDDTTTTAVQSFPFELGWTTDWVDVTAPGATRVAIVDEDGDEVCTGIERCVVEEPIRSGHFEPRPFTAVVEAPVGTAVEVGHIRYAHAGQQGDHGSSPETATPLRPGRVVGSHGRRGQSAWFRIEEPLSDGLIWTESWNDTVGTFYDDDGNALHTDDDSGPGYDFLLATFGQTGWVEVTFDSLSVTYDLVYGRDGVTPACDVVEPVAGEGLLSSGTFDNPRDLYQSSCDTWSRSDVLVEWTAPSTGCFQLTAKDGRDIRLDMSRFTDCSTLVERDCGRDLQIDAIAGQTYTLGIERHQESTWTLEATACPTDGLVPVQLPSTRVDRGSELCEDGVCWQHPLPMGPRVVGDIEVVGPDDVWFAWGGIVQHFDGMGFRSFSGPPGGIRDLWVSPTGTLWTVSGRKLVYTSPDGVTWTQQTQEGMNCAISALRLVWGTSDDEVFVVGDGRWNSRWRVCGWRGDGVGPWESVHYASHNSAFALDGSGSDHVWFTGRDRTWVWDGLDKEHEFVAGWVRDVDVVSATETWLAMDGFVERVDGDATTDGAFTRTSWPIPRDLDPTGIQHLGPDDVWLTVDDSALATSIPTGLFHFDGVDWTPQALTPELSGCRQVSGITGELWASCGYALFRHDGTAWTQHADYTTHFAMDASVVDGHAWVAGGNGLLHNDGTGWSTVIVDDPDRWVRAVWMASTTDGWAVGDGGRLLRYDGTRWTDVPNVTHHRLTDVWGSSPWDVWAVGEDSTVLHYDGHTWTAHRIGGGKLQGVWGSSASDVWIVGEEGYAAHYDGLRWTHAPTGSPHDLMDIIGDGGDLWVVGDGGTVLHHDGTGWTPIPGVDGEARLNRVVRGAGGQLWATSYRHNAYGIWYHGPTGWIEVDTGQQDSLVFAYDGEIVFGSASGALYTLE
jgi:hypothetical protein